MSSSKFGIPATLRYTREHEWAELGPDLIVTIGITDYAQDALGDITFLELPEPGRSLKVMEGFGVVESVKTFSDLYAPVAGEVVEVNEAAKEDPAMLNVTPYGEGWLVRVKVASSADFESLMTAAAYAAYLDSLG